VAGIFNAMAGGASLLTVPLLVLAGVPGNSANGTNRVGVLVSNATAMWGFHRRGVPGVRDAVPMMVPAIIGSLVGAYGVSQLTDEAFERAFGLVMLPLLVVALRPPRVRTDAAEHPWPRWATFAVFFGIGVYGGSFQAGIGIFLVLALSHAGFDLVQANSIKVVVIFVITAIALPVFILAGQVRWVPAIILSIGFAAGGWVGAHLAVERGERLIRPLLVVATVALAGRMLGLY
jgi:uncharacterized membrane protein YfcA